MKMLRAFAIAVTICIGIAPQSMSASQFTPVTLPLGDGKIVGAAFSPDSSRVALLRNVEEPGGNKRHILQIVELQSGQDIGHVEVLDEEPSDLFVNTHLLGYSSSSRHLLLATRGSDVVTIVDVTTLRKLWRVNLHPATDARTSLSVGHRYFRGVVCISTASNGDAFGILTSDEMQGQEVFIGSFSSGQIVKHWRLGSGRIATQLGEVALSLA